MQAYQRDFIRFAIERGVLRFGEFTLKSGRTSPYFFNAGLFNSGAALAQLGRFYAEAVVEKEWPAMAQRKASPEAGQAYEQIWLAYYAFQPETDQQKIWYAESLRKLNDLGDQRRLRLLAARSEGVPGVMWVVLLGAGVITIGFSLLFGTRSAAAHLLMTGGVGITIGLVLLSIIAMHQPFSGIARVDTEAFDQTLEILGGGKR